MVKNFTKQAFTQTVRDIQEENGSRKSYARMEKTDKYELGDAEKAFIEMRDGFYMSTVGENGWPYVQYRGGKPGFLKVLEKSLMGFADFRGNMQYISTGNIADTKKASLFLMDYANRSRLKIWAEARIEKADPDSELYKKLVDPEYPAQIERLFLFDVVGFDWNCPQHITERFTVEEFQSIIERGDARLF